MRAEFEKAIEFLHSIGIVISFEPMEEDGFLPGLAIKNGTIIVDRDKLKYPGDIIHEAGHIAVVPANERPMLNEGNIETRQDRDAEEMMAIAWSYAVCVHLQIDPYFVFHDHGYKGTGKPIADHFKKRQYFGVSMLQYAGMTKDITRNNVGEKIIYPQMEKWMRE